MAGDRWPLLLTATGTVAAGAALTWLRLQSRRKAKAAAAALALEPKRDFAGYGRHPPVAAWPKRALVALNFCLNLEEGSEPGIPDGDAASSGALCECGSEAPAGVRDLAAEGMFEYGSRCGVWRVLRAFEEKKVPATLFACALAMERLPDLAEALRDSPLDFDVCCHGWRWEDHIAMPESVERERIARATASLTRTMGRAPEGWYCRTAPSVNTRRLLAEHGGFQYDSDAYNDDLPYWTEVALGGGKEPVWSLVVPYSLCTNDSKFAPGRAFSTGEDFFVFMRDSLNALLEEATSTGVPKMMSVGLHMRLIGLPARIEGLRRFMDYVQAKGPEQVWLCRRADLAAHWRALHPPPSGEPAARQGQGPRLLVTGGAGFVLCNLVHHWLESDCSASCVIFDLPKAWDDAVRSFLAPFLESGRLRLFFGDVASPAAWRALRRLHGAEFTHAVAGAALTPTDKEELERAEAVMRVNLDGLLNCLSEARSWKGRPRLLHISSDVVKAHRAEESSTSLLPPLSAYAISKVAGEAVVQRWRELYNLDAASVRFSDVYGRLDRDTGARCRHNAPYWVLKRLRTGNPVRVRSDSLDELGWDYIDAPSVARGLRLLLLGKSAMLPVYELALGRCVTHRELLEGLGGAAAVAAAQLVEEGEEAEVASLAPGHWLRNRGFDVAAMDKEFAWRAAPLDEALRDYAAWEAAGRA